MLQDLSGGRVPTDEECSFVLHVADLSDNVVDGYIGRNELEVAIQVWRNYLGSMDEISAYFAKYDVNQSGKLEKEQLKALLTDLNDGKAPSEDEIEAIMEEADGLAGQQTGGINRTELTGAISLWYGFVEQHQRCCCLM